MPVLVCEEPPGERGQGAKAGTLQREGAQSAGALWEHGETLYQTETPPAWLQKSAIVYPGAFKGSTIQRSTGISLTADGKPERIWKCGGYRPSGGKCSAESKVPGSQGKRNCHNHGSQWTFWAHTGQGGLGDTAGKSSG